MTQLQKQINEFVNHYALVSGSNKSILKERLQAILDEHGKEQETKTKSLIEKYQKKLGKLRLWNVDTKHIPECQAVYESESEILIEFIKDLKILNAPPPNTEK